MNKVKLFMYNRGLLRMSGSEAICLMLEVDEEKKRKVLKFKDLYFQVLMGYH